MISCAQKEVSRTVCRPTLCAAVRSSPFLQPILLVLSLCSDLGLACAGFPRLLNNGQLDTLALGQANPRLGA
jgi:hypothetical protein